MWLGGPALPGKQPGLKIVLKIASVFMPLASAAAVVTRNAQFAAPRTPSRHYSSASEASEAICAIGQLSLTKVAAK